MRKKAKRICLTTIIFVIMALLTGCVSIGEAALKDLFKEFVRESENKVQEIIEEKTEEVKDSITGDMVIRYDARGGVFSSAISEDKQIVEKQLGSKKILLTEQPQKPGQHFMGWSKEYNSETDEVGKVKYQAGDRFLNLFDNNLYAVWMSHDEFMDIMCDVQSNAKYSVTKLLENHNVKSEGTDGTIECTCGAQLSNPDSNADGISDYCTRLLACGKRIKEEIYPFRTAIDWSLIDNGSTFDPAEIRYLTIQKNADLDYDGIKNGDELIVELLSDYSISVEMLSDPAWDEPDSYYLVDDAAYKQLVQGNYAATLFSEDFGGLTGLGIRKEVASEQILESLIKYVDTVSQKKKCENHIKLLKQAIKGLTGNMLDLLGDASDISEPFLEVNGLSLKSHLETLNEMGIKVRELEGNLVSEFGLETIESIDKLNGEYADLIKILKEETKDLESKGLDEEQINKITECFELKLDIKALDKVKKGFQYVEVVDVVFDVCSEIKDWKTFSDSYAYLHAEADMYEEIYWVLEELTNEGKFKFVRKAAKLIQDETLDSAEILGQSLFSGLANPDTIIDVAEIVAQGAGPYLWAASIGISIGEGITNKKEVTEWMIRAVTASEMSEACVKVFESKFIQTGNIGTYMEEDSYGTMRLLAYLRNAGEEAVLKLSAADRKNIKDILGGMDYDEFDSNTKGNIERVNKIIDEYFKEYDMKSAMPD